MTMLKNDVDLLLLLLRSTKEIKKNLMSESFTVLGAWFRYAFRNSVGRILWSTVAVVVCMFTVSDAAKSVDGRVLWTGIGFELDQGQICAVSGPSGTGKSTLLRALAGLDPLPSGSLSLDGKSYEAIGPTLWRRNASSSQNLRARLPVQDVGGCVFSPSNR